MSAKIQPDWFGFPPAPLHGAASCWLSIVRGRTGPPSHRRRRNEVQAAAVGVAERAFLRKGPRRAVADVRRGSPSSRPSRRHRTCSRGRCSNWVTVTEIGSCTTTSGVMCAPSRRSSRSPSRCPRTGRSPCRARSRSRSSRDPVNDLMVAPPKIEAQSRRSFQLTSSRRRRRWRRRQDDSVVAGAGRDTFG